LPTGSTWYNYWTNERFEGGQTIETSAPIDTIPLFVKAGSIVPLGSKIESTHDKQSVERFEVYAGADGDFTLYNDDGQTYAYERGEFETTHLRWDDKARKLERTGTKEWNREATLEVVGAH
jgi:alpha-D-xyloside xylohydrolase